MLIYSVFCRNVHVTERQTDMLDTVERSVCLRRLANRKEVDIANGFRHATEWSQQVTFVSCVHLLLQQADTLLVDSLEEKYRKAVPEVAVYLKEGVGNKTRIDYGTGEPLTATVMQNGRVTVRISKHLT